MNKIRINGLLILKTEDTNNKEKQIKNIIIE